MTTIEDIFVMPGRGRVFLVRTDVDDPQVGELVYLARNGVFFSIGNVEAYAKLGRPKAGDFVGLMFAEDSTELRIGDMLEIVR